MYKWRIIEKTFTYDGTIEGLFTIVSDCIEKKEIPIEICEEEKYEVTLLSEIQYIATDYDKSIIVFADIAEKISARSLHYVYSAFKSGNKEKELEIVKYLIYGFKYGGKINAMKNLPCVSSVQDLSQNVQGEAHKLTGFVRFRQLDNSILFSEIGPKNNVVDILADHFSKRMPNEFWIINDKHRNIAAVYDKKKYLIVDSMSMDISKLKNCKSEEIYQRLWKNFCKDIAIKERTNRRCQLNFMPKRYWAYMTEMEDEK